MRLPYFIDVVKSQRIAGQQPQSGKNERKKERKKGRKKERKRERKKERNKAGYTATGSSIWIGKKYYALTLKCIFSRTWN